MFPNMYWCYQYVILTFLRYHEVIKSYSLWNQGSHFVSPWQFLNCCFEFEKMPHSSLVKAPNNYACFILLCETFQMTHAYLSCMMFLTQSTKNIYQQITQHYLEELIKVAMHCKGQTVSFQMTSILCWSRPGMSNSVPGEPKPFSFNPN